MIRCGFYIFCDLNGLFNFLHYLFKVRSILFVTMQLFVSQENMLTVDELKIFVDLDIYIHIYIYIFRSCVRSELVYYFHFFAA